MCGVWCVVYDMFVCMVSPSLYQEEKDDSKSLEALINGEGTDLNLCNNPTLFYCALPGRFP